MSVERVAEVLDAHHINIFGPTTVDGFECTCGAWVAQAHLAAHQAEMLRAEGLVATETEWAVEYWDADLGPAEHGYLRRRDEASARKALLGEPGERVVARNVTPWRPA